MSISDYLCKIMELSLEKLINSGKFIPPSADYPIKTDETANLNFIVWGDPQISLISPLRAARVFFACKDIKNSAGKFDALLLLGDITEFGTKSEYKLAQKLLSDITDKFDNIIAVPGNHDIRLRRHGKQICRFNSFLKGIENGVSGVDGRYYFSKYINGYKFIMMGSDRATFEASFVSDRQLEWLDNELKSEIDSEKPVFVLNHWPLKNTNGLPVTFLGKGKWRGTIGNESDKVRKVFEKYKNIIYITGHLHYCTSKYTYEDHGSFKAISAPTVGVLNHGEYDKLTQGYVVSVYENKIVAKSRIFGEGIYTEKNVPNSEFQINLN